MILTKEQQDYVEAVYENITEREDALLAWYQAEMRKLSHYTAQHDEHFEIAKVNYNVRQSMIRLAMRTEVKPQ